MSETAGLAAGRFRFRLCVSQANIHQLVGWAKVAHELGQQQDR